MTLEVIMMMIIPEKDEMNDEDDSDNDDDELNILNAINKDTDKQ